MIFAFHPPAFPCVKFLIITSLLRLSNLVSGTCLITFPVEVPGDGSFRYSCVRVGMVTSWKILAFSSGFWCGSMSPPFSSSSSEQQGDLLSFFATVFGVVLFCWFFFELLPLPVPFPFGVLGVSPFWVGGSACFAIVGVFVTFFGKLGVSPFWVGGSACFAIVGVFVTFFGKLGVSPFWVGGTACFASVGVFVVVCLLTILEFLFFSFLSSSSI